VHDLFKSYSVSVSTEHPNLQSLFTSVNKYFDKKIKRINMITHKSELNPIYKFVTR